MNLDDWIRILRRWREAAEARFDRIDDRLDAGKSYVDTRLDASKSYADNHFYRAAVVTTLPADASFGYLMVKPGDINLYVGTGVGTPLRKIPTQATP